MFLSDFLVSLNSPSRQPSVAMVALCPAPVYLFFVPSSIHTTLVKAIKQLKQTIKDSQHLKKELAKQIRELDARLKKLKAAHLKAAKRGS